MPKAQVCVCQGGEAKTFRKVTADNFPSHTVRTGPGPAPRS
jgi:hypothetical protein